MLPSKYKMNIIKMAMRAYINIPREFLLLFLDISYKFLAYLMAFPRIFNKSNKLAFSQNVIFRYLCSNIIFYFIKITHEIKNYIKKMLSKLFIVSFVCINLKL